MSEYLARYAGITIGSGDGAGEQSHQVPFYREYRFESKNRRTAIEKANNRTSSLEEELNGNIKLTSLFRIEEIPVKISDSDKEWIKSFTSKVIRD